jgi:hypothetical protein
MPLENRKIEPERGDILEMTAVVTDALRPWDGKHATMSAHIATATR